MKKNGFAAALVFAVCCCILFAFTYCTGKNSGTKNTVSTHGAGKDTSIVGIANIVENKDGSTSYNFNEYQTVFTVTKEDKNWESFLRIAKASKEKNQPVKIMFTNPNTLTNLVTPDEKEMAAYLEKRRYDLKDTDQNVSVSLDRIDTSTFNLVEYQKWKVFRLCTKVIPSYADAVTIFNFCAAQQCRSGPTQITPCIPFQYVKDGCFARAHKMRYIIETKYKYCSEKVFSYSYMLDVKAAKWGGCCVSWWYHVAPLVRVQTKRGVACYVIDPGMFDKPVTLSTWLGAQQSPDCATGDTNTTYSIQPSSAYQPSYSIDPNYTQTNADLLHYNTQGPTCPN